MDNDVFMYTHQGYIANFNYIKEVKKDVVCFGRGMEVPLSRKYHDQIKELHMNKIRRAYKAVSYTHLDVYKRQAIYNVHRNS